MTKGGSPLKKWKEPFVFGCLDSKNFGGIHYPNNHYYNSHRFLNIFSDEFLKGGGMS